MPKKTYSVEFKLQTFNLTQQENMTTSQAARDLGANRFTARDGTRVTALRKTARGGRSGLTTMYGNGLSEQFWCSAR